MHEIEIRQGSTSLAQSLISDPLRGAIKDIHGTLMKKMFLIFNHTLTQRQQKDAVDSLKVTEFIHLPNDLQQLWQRIPTSSEKIAPCLQPLEDWLLSHAQKGDYVLIQGDFGACYLMVKFAHNNGYIPVYSTTQREAIEMHDDDGSIHMQHIIKHCRYRQYGD